MTANFDTKHLLKKLRSLFRKLYSTCFVFAATDCFDRYTWCHLVPQHKVCDHEFYGTHCCLSCKGHRWCLIWCSTTTIQFLLWYENLYVFLFPYTVTWRFNGEGQWKYVPSLLSSTTRQAVRDTAGFVVRFLLIQVIHNVPNTIFDIIFKESNECKFLILQAMCYRNRKLKHE